MGETIPDVPSSSPHDPEAEWWDRAGVDGLTALLYWCWDPIGVSAVYPDARDEYATYARALGRMLRAGAGPDAVAGYLRGAEESEITLATDDDRRRCVAARVVAWHSASVHRLTAETRFRR